MSEPRVMRPLTIGVKCICATQKIHCRREKNFDFEKFSEQVLILKAQHSGVSATDVEQLMQCYVLTSVSYRRWWQKHSVPLLQ